MKYLIIFSILFISTFSSSQNYLDSNPEWTEYTISGGAGNPYFSSKEYNIKLEADTIINNVTYYKTKREGLVTTWNWVVDTLVSEVPLDDYLFPIREDQGRFYFYHTVQEKEKLLHDFNLSIGDTAVAASYCDNPQIVMEIDTVYFGTQVRKKFIFAPHLTFGVSPLYEGIGTSRGLFVMPCSGTVGIESGSSLYCFTTGEETIQIDTLGQCETSIPVNIKELQSQNQKIYPNPFNDRIVIENEWKGSNNFEIKLYDYGGNLIISKSMNGFENITEISTIDLNSGLYVLLILEEHQIRTYKIIKVKM